MFVVCQFPVSDARAFLPQDTRLPAPHWREPRPGEFVRGFGPISDRRSSAFTGYSDEECFASAHQAIKIPNLAKGAVAHGRVGAVCAFRRLYCDDGDDPNGRPLARVEVGLRVATAGSLRANEIDELITSALDLPVRVRSLEAESEWTPVALSAAGSPLSRLLATATTKAGHTPSNLVTAEAPALLLQYRGFEVEALPADARVIDSTLTGGVPLAFVRREHRGQPIAIWLLRARSTNSPAERNLRVALLRVHAEYQALRRVLIALADGAVTLTPGTPEGERLEQYLNRATTMLPELYPGAALNKTICNVLHACDEPLPADQRASIGEALQKARRQNREKIERYIETAEQAHVNADPDAAPIHVFVSYSHTDEDFVRLDSEKSILAYLAALKAEGFLFWHDRELYASQIWDEHIKHEMTLADIALVLVSHFFLNSRYITDTEMPALLAARRTKGLSILPLLVSESEWASHEWLSKTLFLPPKGTLRLNYVNRGRLFKLYHDVAVALRKIGAEKRKGLARDTLPPS